MVLMIIMTSLIAVGVVGAVMQKLFQQEEENDGKNDLRAEAHRDVAGEGGHGHHHEGE